MSDDSVLTPSGNFPGVWSALERQGYALTTDQAIGLPEKFRTNFTETYFVDGIIRHDDGDWPADRKRARDVVRYQWGEGDALELDEFDTISINNRAGIKGKRDHQRVELVADPQSRELIRAFLRLVPPGRRKSIGTFGVNLFRTYTNVVTIPHRDNEEFILLYVLNRVGEGAETYLYKPESVTSEGHPTTEPVLRKQLQPGDLIIFEDKLFKHGATPLKAPSYGQAMRDVLVCTVDYESTYLQQLTALA